MMDPAMMAPDTAIHTNFTQDLDDDLFDSLVSDLHKGKFVEEEYSDYEEYDEQ
jgi:hypothetical protein